MPFFHLSRFCFPVLFLLTLPALQWLTTPMDEKIITIARYDQAALAHVGRVCLEAADIPAMVANDNQPGLLFFHAVVGHSVELQVFERDAQEALAILLEDVQPEKTGETRVFDGDASIVTSVPTRPACDAPVFRRNFGRWICPLFLGASLLIFVLFAIVTGASHPLGLLLVRLLNRRHGASSCVVYGPIIRY
jgi:hypothetical protein